MSEAFAQTSYTDREIIEALLDALQLANAGITRTVKIYNGMEQRSYRVVITTDREYNEIQIKLKEL